MTKWTFEPGHTAAEFCARHMMVANVRGHFKDVHGTLNFDPDNPLASSVEVVIEANKIWTGEAARDAHLRSADFLDVENFPEITFSGNQVVVIGEVDFQVTGNLTIRGVTRPVTLEVHYLGQWQTPWWEEGVDKGPKTRAGFVAKATINRQDFRVNWNDKIDHGGIVVSNNVDITIDVEAILDRL
jgi:polyisoprenoid-binding protein YceI